MSKHRIPSRRIVRGAVLAGVGAAVLAGLSAAPASASEGCTEGAVCVNAEHAINIHDVGVGVGGDLIDVHHR